VIHAAHFKTKCKAEEKNVKTSKIPQKQFLRSLINNMNSRLFAMNTFSKEKRETLFKLSQYLEIFDWPEDINTHFVLHVACTFRIKTHLAHITGHMGCRVLHQ
jgi:hypothetical protein